MNWLGASMKRAMHTLAAIVVPGLLALATSMPAIAATAPTQPGQDPDHAASSAEDQSYTYKGVTYTWTQPDGSDMAAQSTPGAPDQLPPGVDPSSIPDSTAPGTLIPTPGMLGDGCTNVPDSFGKANFYPACEKHDACYSANSRTDRSDCDSALRSNLLRACAKGYPTTIDPRRIACNNQAINYYLGVRSAGWAYYEGQGSNLSTDQPQWKPENRPVKEYQHHGF